MDNYSYIKRNYESLVSEIREYEAKLSRKITKREYQKVLDHLIDLELDGFAQELESAVKLLSRLHNANIQSKYPYRLWDQANDFLENMIVSYDDGKSCQRVLDYIRGEL